MTEPLHNGASIESLLAGLAPASRMIEFYEAHLGAIRDYDHAHRADLIRTLDTYFSTGGSLSATASLLRTHRNTVLYRIRRIEELAAVSLRDPAVALEMQVALRIAAALNH